MVDLNLPTPGQDPNWAPQLNAEIEKINTEVEANTYHNWVNTATTYVDYFEGATDSEKISAAWEHVAANGSSRLVFAPREYLLDGAIFIPEGTDGLLIEGAPGRTVFRRNPDVPGTGGTFAISPRNAPVRNITFYGLTTDGQCLNLDAMGNARARGTTASESGTFLEFAQTRLRAFLNVWGARMPMVTTGDVAIQNPYAKVENIIVENCRMIGLTSLPVDFQGVDGFAIIRNCEIVRCLDPGWVWSDNCQFTGNRSILSQDNGVSISRGCRTAIVTDNVIDRPWYNGVWVGGFQGTPAASGSPASGAGPSYAYVAGNTTILPGEHGVYAGGSAGRLVIEGNNLTGGALPPSKDASSGAGIYVTPWSVANTQIPTSVTITGNNIDDFVRCGIDCRGARSLTVVANTLRNIGSTTNPNGTSRPAGATQRVGVSVTESTTLATTLVNSNNLVETRGGSGTPAFARGILINAGASASSVTGNVIFGTSIPITDHTGT